MISPFFGKLSVGHQSMLLCKAQKLGKSFEGRQASEKQKGPVSGAFPVAGAGFEPATSGL
jgi:hypothetical protein